MKLLHAIIKRAVYTNKCSVIIDARLCKQYKVVRAVMDWITDDRAESDNALDNFGSALFLQRLLHV